MSDLRDMRAKAKRVKTSELEHVDIWRPIEGTSSDNIDDKLLEQLDGLFVVGAFPANNKNAKIPIHKLRGNTAFREWQLRNREKGDEVTYKQWLDYLQDPATEAANRMNNLCDNRDKVIGGYWWAYNEQSGEYENTGEIAKGNVMLPVFDIDIQTGILSMVVDDEYSGPNFIVNEDGNLELVIQ